jgi:hypothetical protein
MAEARVRGRAAVSLGVMRRVFIFIVAGVAACAPDNPPATRTSHVVVQESAPASMGELDSSSLAAPKRDPVAIANALETRTLDTYLPELLEMRGGWSYRWPDRRLEPMRVWIEPSALPGYNSEFARAVEASFNDWANIGLPFIFTFVRDSSRAEVHVTWVDRFEERMTGRTLWRHDRHGWIVGGSIELALHLPDGRPVVLDGVRAIALHEVGHLVGLDHPSDETSVMASQVFVTQMNEADRRTARLIYDLPPGRLRP